MNLKEITDTAKTALTIANELKNLELKEAILNLKEQMLALREENLALKEQLQEKQKYNMQFKNNTYWNIKEDGKKEGPYCPTCWDADGKAVRLLKSSGYDGPICLVCRQKKYAKS